MGNQLKVELGRLNGCFTLIIGDQFIAEKDSRAAISSANRVMMRIIRLLIVDFLTVVNTPLRNAEIYKAVSKISLNKCMCKVNLLFIIYNMLN